MKKTDKELADEIDARKRLENHGYRKVPCPNPHCLTMRIHGDKCPRCHGKGYTWEAPLT